MWMRQSSFSVSGFVTVNLLYCFIYCFVSCKPPRSVFKTGSYITVLKKELIMDQVSHPFKRKVCEAWHQAS